MLISKWNIIQVRKAFPSCHRIVFQTDGEFLVILNRKTINIIVPNILIPKDDDQTQSHCRYLLAPRSQCWLSYSWQQWRFDWCSCLLEHQLPLGAGLFFLRITKLMKSQDKNICPKCHHNMGRSRCKPNPDNDKWMVRCNKCKTIYDVTIIFPSTEDSKVSQ